MAAKFWPAVLVLALGIGCLGCSQPRPVEDPAVKKQLDDAANKQLSKRSPKKANDDY